MATATKSTKPAPETKRIDAREAAGIASNYLRAVIPRAQLIDANVMLEEIEESVDRERWLITMGFDGPPVFQKVSGVMAGILPDTRERGARVYKLFTIDKKTGRVISMKIRSLP